MRTRVDAIGYRLHSRGVRDGREVVVLRTPNLSATSEEFDDFWVDVLRDSAIVRQDHYLGGHLRSSYDIEYDRSDNGWLPTRWQLTMSDGKNIRALRKAHNVRVEMSGSFDDVDFHMEPAPGMFFQDARTDRTYRKGAAGEPDEDAEDHIRRDRANTGWGNTAWAVIGVGAIVALAALALAVRHLTCRKAT